MDKILVIDDDVDILTLVKMSLVLNGFNVEAVSQWEHIDNRIVGFKPDLILLDVSLAGADGRVICKRIKAAEETMHIPVILFSANTEIEKAAGDCNAQAFISKPYELAHLLKTIRKTLDESKA